MGQIPDYLESSLEQTVEEYSEFDEFKNRFKDSACYGSSHPSAAVKALIASLPDTKDPNADKEAELKALAIKHKMLKLELIKAEKAIALANKELAEQGQLVIDAKTAGESDDTGKELLAFSAGMDIRMLASLNTIGSTLSSIMQQNFILNASGYSEDEKKERIVRMKKADRIIKSQNSKFDDRLKSKGYNADNLKDRDFRQMLNSRSRRRGVNI